jgi:hypothetical protein
MHWGAVDGMPDQLAGGRAYQHDVTTLVIVDDTVGFCDTLRSSYS